MQKKMKTKIPISIRLNPNFIIAFPARSKALKMPNSNPQNLHFEAFSGTEDLHLPQFFKERAVSWPVNIAWQCRHLTA